jgi:hypothetical protein
VGDAFLIGWLDAVWASFGADDWSLPVPRDVSRAFVRRGWVKPRKATSEDGVRDITVTPLGERAVVGANKVIGIRRQLYNDDGDEVTEEEWEAAHGGPLYAGIATLTPEQFEQALRDLVDGVVPAPHPERSSQ